MLQKFAGHEGAAIQINERVTVWKSTSANLYVYTLAGYLEPDDIWKVQQHIRTLPSIETSRAIIIDVRQALLDRIGASQVRRAADEATLKCIRGMG